MIIIIILDQLGAQKNEERFNQWIDPYIWHLLYADNVTCDSSGALHQDVAFVLELYNADSQGQPRNHFSYDEKGQFSQQFSKLVMLKNLY